MCIVLFQSILLNISLVPIDRSVIKRRSDVIHINEENFSGFLKAEPLSTNLNGELVTIEWVPSGRSV